MRGIKDPLVQKSRMLTVLIQHRDLARRVLLEVDDYPRKNRIIDLAIFVAKGAGNTTLLKQLQELC